LYALLENNAETPTGDRLMKEYDTSTHDTPVTVERNTDECCCVKHCKGYTMNWYNVVCIVKQ